MYMAASPRVMATVRDSSVGFAVACEDFPHQAVDVSIDEQAHMISADLVVVCLGIDAIAPADNLVGAAEDGTQSHAGRKGYRQGARETAWASRCPASWRPACNAP